MNAFLEATILGSGSSGGVPRADGDWGRCNPQDPHNWRSRCSLAVRRVTGETVDPLQQTTVIVDVSPDFRTQAVRCGVKRIDQVLFSHDHADQTHGIDDIRAFSYRQRGRIPCRADAATEATLLRRFRYVFEGEKGYPPIATLSLLPAFGTPFFLDGPSGAIPVLTYDQDHGDVRAVGYRFGNVAYSSDVVGLPDASIAALQGLDVFVVDALRYAPHPSHAHLDLALQWIAALQPRRAILTNLHIDLDYQTLCNELPMGVEPAYDGLTFRSALPDVLPIIIADNIP
jgi:phosphoribosyl 1,2-cyclic phosphate phosphodiesterase